MGIKGGETGRRVDVCRNTRTRNKSLASLACNAHTDLEIQAVLTFGLTQEGLEKSQVNDNWIILKCPRAKWLEKARTVGSGAVKVTLLSKPETESSGWR